MSEYGADGFIPTVNNVRRERDRLVMETIDSREETDLISDEEGLRRRADLLSDEQDDQLAQYET